MINEQNIDAIVEFAEVLNDNPDYAYDFICNNYYKKCANCFTMLQRN